MKPTDLEKRKKHKQMYTDIDIVVKASVLKSRNLGTELDKALKGIRALGLKVEDVTIYDVDSTEI
jgi:hypothetical protein